MIDNKYLDKLSQRILDDLSYESMVNIYDNNCLSCPFKLLEVRRGKIRIGKFEKLDTAIQVYLHSTSSDTRLVRGCEYGDIELTLKEIVSNTCRFWRVETCEGGENEIEPSFIEVSGEKVDVSIHI